MARFYGFHVRRCVATKPKLAEHETSSAQPQN